MNSGERAYTETYGKVRGRGQERKRGGGASHSGVVGDNVSAQERLGFPEVSGRRKNE